MATGIFTFQLNSAHAQPCNDLGGWVVSVEGAFTVAGNLTQMGEAICSGDKIVVGQGSRGAIRLASSQTIVRVNQNSSFVIEPSGTNGSLLKLFKGVLYLFSRQPESLRVDTPYINAAIDGTEFVIETSTESSEITVIEGSVSASNAQGSVRVTPGEFANAGPNEAPKRRTVIDPLDAVQWALYYPPIGAAENTSAAIRSAAEMLARGDVEKAEALLVASPEDAASLALKAIIAVTRNQSAEALQLAQRAVNADPNSSMAYSALSYAQQAAFDIDQALASARQAVRNDPGNTDALARQAELQLGVDETADALLSAREAVRVNPTNSRARTILGFVHLVRLDVGKAQEAFSEAIDLDPGDPSPRLGLGLAVIRDGRLIEGREHIEVAASLDPANALVRSYLGKAYFEERQTGDASAQFELAKGLDPQDPTAWFYDALLDQALNRPVSAYEKINRARELNDNRLIYQSRLLVDKSAAAGSLSLAKIYTDLGFEQPAINESTRSIATDTTNYSAYRLLADSYADRVRHESARRNVMFQASLLQPMTINPAQPYAQVSDLLILPGSSPIHPSINEYSPLFDRQGFQLAGSLVAGNEQTLGDNLVLSGLHDRFTYSLGQFHYETEGFRPNNDIEHDIYHGFFQVQALPNLYVQAEFRSRQTEKGDLALNFNDEEFSRDLRVNIESDSPRFGIRAELNPSSMLLVSAEAIDQSEKSVQISEPLISEPLILNGELDISGYQGSARFIYHSSRFSQAAGIDSYDITFKDEAFFTDVNGEMFPALIGNNGSRYTSFHYYADLIPTKKLQWTLGLNHSKLDDDQLNVNINSLDPKIGVRWSIGDASEIRSVLSRGRKLNSNADRTLEPTILAGFNQLYDDFVGTKYLNAGFGFDRHAGTAVRSGIEIFHRELDVPRLLQLEPGPPVFTTINEAQRETTVRGYWNRILNSHMSLSIELLYEIFKRSDDVKNSAGESVINHPLSLETLTLPVLVGYSNPSGFFAQGKISFVRQSVENRVESGSSLGESESFAIADLRVGFKYPSNRLLNATFRLDVFNLFDEKFSFQDHNIQSSRETSPRFSPGRSIVGRVSFSF